MASGRRFNLADLFEIVADAVPDREALVCGERRLSYREVDERTTRLAHWLSTRGIGAGDHVAVYLHNSIEYLETMLAAFKVRAVPINVNHRYVAGELRYLLDDAEARAIVYDPAFGATLDAARPDLPRLHVLLDLDGYEDALAASSPERDFGPRSEDDRYILYTGGTTGMPKGVVWRHEDVFFAALNGGNPGGEPASHPEDLARSAPEGRTRSLPASPMMHGTAHWIALTALYSGGTVVIDPDHRLDGEALWRLVARERVSFLTIVGDAFARPLVEALRRHGDDLDVSCCRVVLSGGAIFSAAVKTELAERLPGAIVVDSYGASETGGQGRMVVTAGQPARAPRFTLDADTTLLDDDLRPVTEPGRVGRLARRGRIPLGYHRDERKTATTFPVVHGERWAVPGDYGILEADGTVTLLGRGSVSINTGGEKVYPEEVESVLKGHEAVFDAVVVGVPDERWGERVVAVIEPRAGHRAPTLASLESFVRDQLADYKIPRAALLVDRIERAPTGKTDYRWARQVAEVRAAEAS